MNARIPVTALSMALGLACTAAFAAQPINAAASAPSSQAVQGTRYTISSNVTVKPVVRKVYDFATLDRNHNGMLSRAEIPHDMVNLRRDFVRADYDHNGQLSPEEYVLYKRGLAPQYTGTFHHYTYTYRTGGNNVERINLASQ